MSFCVRGYDKCLPDEERKLRALGALGTERAPILVGVATKSSTNGTSNADVFALAGSKWLRDERRPRSPG